MLEIGEKRLASEEEKIRHLQQGFGGIKEILITGNFEYFIKRFHQPNKIAGLMHKREYIFQYVPKLGVESIAVLGLVGMCLFLVVQGKPAQEVMKVLGLMATAGFRLIPSFSRILNNLQAMRFGWASVDTLVNAFEEKSLNNTNPKPVSPSCAPVNEKLVFRKCINFSNIEFSFPESSKKLFMEHLCNKKGRCYRINGGKWHR